MEQNATFGQFPIPDALAERVDAWQQAWQDLYREPVPAAGTPLEDLRAADERRRIAAAHLLGMAYVLLSDLRDGSTSQSERVTADRMPDGDAYPYRPDHAGTSYDVARGPFEPVAEPAGAAR